MNFTVIEIVHLWADSRGTVIDMVFPSKGKIYVCCEADLSKEAKKVCSFMTLVVKQPWTFQMQRNDDKYWITFFPEKISLDNLFA